MSLYEPIKECDTPAEMRAELHRLTYKDNLINRVMTSANYNGLSSEDRYTMLAYYALQERHLFRDRCLEFMDIIKPLPMIIPKENSDQQP